MRIWNGDGGEVESCGNATRCVVQLTGAKNIETAGGLLSGEQFGEEVEVSLPRAALRLGRNPPCLSDGHGSAADGVGSGSNSRWRSTSATRTSCSSCPMHARCRWKTLGPRIENDPAFPERINVNVGTYVHDRLKLRTFERGAGETLACGTGACASAVAAIVSKRAQSPVRVDMTGGSLTISWAAGEPIRMRGTATHVFSGELDLEALQ